MDTEKKIRLYQRNIRKLKNNLRKTDYQAIKYAEGEMSEEEYSPIKVQRREWRKTINELEEALNSP